MDMEEEIYLSLSIKLLCFAFKKKEGKALSTQLKVLFNYKHVRTTIKKRSRFENQSF